jgi:hypothetical protein
MIPCRARLCRGRGHRRVRRRGRGHRRVRRRGRVGRHGRVGRRGHCKNRFHNLVQLILVLCEIIDAC